MRLFIYCIFMLGLIVFVGNASARNVKVVNLCCGVDGGVPSVPFIVQSFSATSDITANISTGDQCAEVIAELIELDYPNSSSIPQIIGPAQGGRCTIFFNFIK